jgi:hypothetical protein
MSPIESKPLGSQEELLPPARLGSSSGPKPRSSAFVDNAFGALVELLLFVEVGLRHRFEIEMSEPNCHSQKHALNH